MQNEIIISGFGGQGVMFSGQLLTYGAMGLDLEVTWLPSYGPEMRGGTANCIVIIADEEIGSPMVRNPSAAIAMNLPSLDRYEPLVKPGGLLVVNGSMVDRAVERTDISSIVVPANEIAESVGNRRMMNTVLLGCLLANADILPLGSIEEALRDHTPERHRATIVYNIQALYKGAEYSTN